MKTSTNSILSNENNTRHFAKPRLAPVRVDMTKFKSYTPSGQRNDCEVMSLSGGRSSAYTLMMLLNGGFGQKENDIISFQNTGKEDETCLQFLKELEDALGLKFTWLEYSLTSKFVEELLFSSFSYDKFNDGGYNHIGEILDIKKLQSFCFEKSASNFWYKEGFSSKTECIKEIDFETASRNGKPFTDVFLYKCAIRIMKGEGLLLPNIGQRWCTGDMKEKVLHRYLKNRGIKTYSKYMGMRADETIRVDKIFRKNDTQRMVEWDCPMFWEKVDKKEVLEAWKNQSIDLGYDARTECNTFRDFLGNCVFCHMKAKLKKQYLIQQGQSVEFYKQIERIVNNYNGDTDMMSRAHGTFESIETEAKNMVPIKIIDVLNDAEIEISCIDCGD